MQIGSACALAAQARLATVAAIRTTSFTAMFTRTDPPEPMQIPPGEVAWLRLAAGSTLQVLEGRALLHEPPQWLAERVVQVPVTLETGAPHRLGRGGWVRLEALGGAALRVQAGACRGRTAGSVTSRPTTERAYR